MMKSFVSGQGFSLAATALPNSSFSPCSYFRTPQNHVVPHSRSQGHNCCNNKCSGTRCNQQGLKPMLFKSSDCGRTKSPALTQSLNIVLLLELLPRSDTLSFKYRLLDPPLQTCGSAINKRPCLPQREHRILAESSIHPIPRGSHRQSHQHVCA